MEVVNTSDLLFSNSTGDHNIEYFTVKLPLYKLVLFIALTFLSFWLNLRVVCIVLTMPAKKRTPNILILHLSLVNILLNYFVVVIFLSRCNVWQLESRYGLCVEHSYIRNTIIALLPVNVTAVAFEKMMVMRKNYVGEKLNIKRTIALMWAVVLVGSLPNLLSTRYITPNIPGTDAECRLQPILGSPRLTLVFELFRLIVFNFLPTVYILYATVQIKSKVSKHLFAATNTTTSVRLRNKVRKVRYIVLNGVVFMVLWLPTAVLLFLYKIYARSSESGESSSDSAKSGLHFFLIVYLGYIYIMLNPLIHLHLSEDLGDLKWYSMRFPRTLTGNATEPENNIEDNTTNLEDGNQKPISAYTSRVSTFQHSMGDASESDFHEIQDIFQPGNRVLQSDEVPQDFV